MEKILYSGACERNKVPIAEVLDRVLPASGTVLEVASGTGQHAAFFSTRYPHLSWQPSDQEERYLQSIEGVVAQQHRDNLRMPLVLDTTKRWPVESADAIFCANMIHISPWEATVGLFSGAGRVLSSGAPLITYGPYRVGGRHTAPSNEAFEQHLKTLDPRFAIRDVDALAELGTKHGLHLEARIAMPANNFVLHWLRT